MDVPSLDQSPHDWGVPHSNWRPNQLSALQQVIESLDGDTKHILLELPTGSGKSGIATALGKTERVIVYVHSLALLDQYVEKYGFTGVKGMDNYSCVNSAVVKPFLEKHKRVPTVAECPMEKMEMCPVYSMCPYIEAREAALQSRRMVCTYPFALLSVKTQFRRGIAVWDEAHSAVSAILQFSTTEIGEKLLNDWALDKPPLFGVKSELDSLSRAKMKDWLATSLKSMVNQQPNRIFIEDVAVWRTALRRLYFAFDAINNTDLFYFESDQKQREVRGKTITDRYALFRPLSPAKYASKLNSNKTTSVLMSATIGDPAPLTKELGIPEFKFFDYPHPVPVHKRPVYDLQFERMTWDNMKKYPLLFKLQAKRIVDWLKEFPADWRGVVMCSSYEKTGRIRDELFKLLPERIYQPERARSRVNAFMTGEFANVAGLIAVDVVQVWGQGLDLAGDIARIAIIQSVPFGNLTDPFELVRRKRFSGNYAWWESYMTVPQGCGRVARGERDEDGDYLLNVAALADGSATSSKALQNYPAWFKQAITPWR